MVSWQYPPNDLWCEFVTSVDGTLVHQDGRWLPWFYAGGMQFGVDAMDYKVGALSLVTACLASPYISGSYENRLEFAPGRELNLENAKLMEFWLKFSSLSDNGGFQSEILITLWGGEGYATKYIHLDSIEWQHFSLKVGPDALAEWIISQGFDWKEIRGITFAWNQKKCSLWTINLWEKFRIDGLLFHFSIDVSIISVESNPISKIPVRLDGAVEGVTPITWTIDPPQPMQITVAEEYQGWIFDNWHDGLKTPGRVVDASIPGVYIVTAFYRSASANGGGGFRWKPGYWITYCIKLLQSLPRKKL